MCVEDASPQTLAPVDEHADGPVAGSASAPIYEPAAHIEQQEAVDEQVPVAIAYQMMDDVEPIVDMDDVEPIDDEASDVAAMPVIVEDHLAPIQLREEPARDHVEPETLRLRRRPLLRLRHHGGHRHRSRLRWPPSAARGVRRSRPSQPRRRRCRSAPRPPSKNPLVAVSADLEQSVAEQAQASRAPQMAPPIATSKRQVETEGRSRST